MLRPEENEILTKVDAGSAMGELLRRHWLPACLSEDLPQPGGPPRRLRLLGEDLVAFRDSHGNVGILEAYCPHRRAHLFWGRNEGEGLRCVYHGWKFAVDGRCLELPSEPETSRFRDKVRAKAYRVAERGGIVWVYMGPAAPEVAPPPFEWLDVPREHRAVFGWVQETNWIQALEGDLDSAHVSFLHRVVAMSLSPHGVSRLDLMTKDVAPELIVKETEYGLVYGARRTADVDKYYWRVTHWILPTISLIPTASSLRRAHLLAPIDNETTFVVHYVWCPDRPLTEQERAKLYNDWTAWYTYGPYRLRDGTIIDTWIPVLNKGNDYQIDREEQRTKSFTGIQGIPNQDRCIQESMGRVVDRSREHLGTSDVAIIAMRRRLLNLAKRLAQGGEVHMKWGDDVRRLRALDTVIPIDSFTRLLETYREHLGMTEALTRGLLEVRG